MKKIFLLSFITISFLMLALASNVNAQETFPKLMNYQGVLLDKNNQPLDEPLVPVTFKIYEQENGGSPVWSEIQDVTAEDGFVNVYLGTITPLDLPFDREYWLEITVRNGQPYPRTRLSAVPWSFRSSISDTASLALDVAEGSVDLDELADEVKIAGGDLEGFYPNPTIKPSAIIDNIDDGSITQDKLAPNVTTPPSGPAGGDLTGTYPDPLIAVGAVKTDRIFNGAVTTVKIADMAVTEEKIANYSVSTDKIQNEAVTSDKIGPEAVIKGKIAEDAVGAYELDETGITAATYGDETHVAQFTVDEDGRLWSAMDVLIQAYDNETLSDVAIDDNDIDNLNLQLREDVVGDFELDETGVAEDTYGDMYNVAQFEVNEDGRIVSAMDVKIEALDDPAVSDVDVTGEIDMLDLQLNPSVVGVNELEAYTDEAGTKPSSSFDNGRFMYYLYDADEPNELRWTDAPEDGKVPVWNEDAGEFNWQNPEVATASPVTGDGTEADPITLRTDGMYGTANHVLYNDGTEWVAGLVTSAMIEDETIVSEDVDDNFEFASVTADDNLATHSNPTGPISLTDGSHGIEFYGFGKTEVWIDGNRVNIDGADDWGDQVVVSDETLLGDGTAGDPLGVDYNASFALDAGNQLGLALDHQNDWEVMQTFSSANADPAIMATAGTGYAGDFTGDVMVDGDVDVTGDVTATTFNGDLNGDVLNGVAGDLIYYPAGDDMDFLGIGAQGQLLAVDAGMPEWTTIEDAGSGTSDVDIVDGTDLTALNLQLYTGVVGQDEIASDVIFSEVRDEDGNGGFDVTNGNRELRFEGDGNTTVTFDEPTHTVEFSTSVQTLEPITGDGTAGNEITLMYDNGPLTLTGTSPDMELTFDHGYTNNWTAIQNFTDIFASGDLEVDGMSNLDNTEVDGDLNVTGNTNIALDLDVDGETNLDNTIVDGTLNVTGTLTGADANFSGIVDMFGATVGPFGLLVLGPSFFADNVDIAMDLNVDGETTLDNTEVDGTLNVTGHLTGTSAAFSGNVDMFSAFIDSGGLFVIGASLFNSTLDVYGAANFWAPVTVNSDLTVTGMTTSGSFTGNGWNITDIDGQKIVDGTVYSDELNDNLEFVSVTADDDPGSHSNPTGPISLTDGSHGIEFYGFGKTEVWIDGNRVNIDGADDWGDQVAETNVPIVGDGTTGDELGLWYDNSLTLNSSSLSINTANSLTWTADQAFYSNVTIGDAGTSYNFTLNGGQVVTTTASNTFESLNVFGTTPTTLLGDNTVFAAVNDIDGSAVAVIENQYCGTGGQSLALELRAGCEGKTAFEVSRGNTKFSGGVFISDWGNRSSSDAPLLDLQSNEHQAVQFTVDGDPGGTAVSSSFTAMRIGRGFPGSTANSAGGRILMSVAQTGTTGDVTGEVADLGHGVLIVYQGTAGGGEEISAAEFPSSPEMGQVIYILNESNDSSALSWDVGGSVTGTIAYGHMKSFVYSGTKWYPID